MWVQGAAPLVVQGMSVCGGAGVEGGAHSWNALDVAAASLHPILVVHVSIVFEEHRVLCRPVELHLLPVEFLHTG